MPAHKTVRANPPIPGHELLQEGHNPTTHRYVVRGGCRCGATPPGYPNVSASATKRWHRQHKAELRARTQPDR
jgi:hypothetical protein